MNMTPAPRRLAKNIVDLFGQRGAEWLAQLPSIITVCEQRWALTSQAPLQNVSYNYVAPAVRADGTAVMLKIGFPNPELYSEIDALQVYDGRGAVQLLDIDRQHAALLLEALRPGLPLLSVCDDSEATRVAASVMRRLWRAVERNHAFASAADWAMGFQRLRRQFDGETGPLPKALVMKAEGLFRELLLSSEPQVLLHGDLHHGNILSAEREPWLSIDPKGIVGEPAYDAATLLRSCTPIMLAHRRPSNLLSERAAILSAELGFDRTRLLSWGLAQAVLSAWWSIEDHGAGWQGAIRIAEWIDEAMGRRSP